MNCKNCEAEIQGSYCHICGQKVLKRFTFRSLAEWFTEEVVVIDKGFLFTIKELIIRPAKVVSDYLSGCTKKYFNPYKLLLVVATTPFLLLSFSEGYKDFPSNLQLLKEAPPSFSKAFFFYVQENFPFFIVINFLGYFLVTIPCWAFFSRLVFRKCRLTYMEHLIFVSFMASASIVLMLTGGTLLYYLTMIIGLGDTVLEIVVQAIPVLLILAIYLLCP